MPKELGQLMLQCSALEVLNRVTFTEIINFFSVHFPKRAVMDTTVLAPTLSDSSTYKELSKVDSIHYSGTILPQKSFKELHQEIDNLKKKKLKN